MKGKIPKDIRILIGEGIAGATLIALVLALKPNEDFTRGLFLGFGAVFAIVSALVAARRITGRRRFGETDERESLLAGKAASIAVFAITMALALYVILAASVPAVREISGTAVAVATVLALTGVYRIGAVILKRLA